MLEILKYVFSDFFIFVGVCFLIFMLGNIVGNTLVGIARGLGPKMPTINIEQKDKKDKDG